MVGDQYVYLTRCQRLILIPLTSSDYVPSIPWTLMMTFAIAVERDLMIVLWKLRPRMS